MTYTPHVTEVPTIALEGEIDRAAVTALQRRISHTLGAGQRRTVVDLGAVTVLGPPTVSLFCAALRRLTRRGATVAVVRAPAPVARVLELCAIDGLEIHASASATMAASHLDPAAQLSALR